MPRQPKKSKYKSVVIKKKRYYFYEILWEDITADGGHATAFEFMGFLPSKMITRAYVFEKDKKHVRTFASYQNVDDIGYGDTNVYPLSVFTKSSQKRIRKAWKEMSRG